MHVDATLTQQSYSLFSILFKKLRVFLLSFAVNYNSFFSSKFRFVEKQQKVRHTWYPPGNAPLHGVVLE